MSATPLRGGHEDEDPQAKAQRLAARAARFSNKLAGNRYKELDAVRQQHLKQLEEAAEREGSSAVGLTSGMDDATLMRGTCEEKCAEYEREFREFTGEINPYERVRRRSRWRSHADGRERMDGWTMPKRWLLIREVMLAPVLELLQSCLRICAHQAHCW